MRSTKLLLVPRDTYIDGFSIGVEKDIQVINFKFLVVLNMSVYNCILGRPFVAMLDVVGSLIRLKLK